MHCYYWTYNRVRALTKTLDDGWLVCHRFFMTFSHFRPLLCTFWQHVSLVSGWRIYLSLKHMQLIRYTFNRPISYCWNIKYWDSFANTTSTTNSKRFTNISIFFLRFEVWSGNVLEAMKKKKKGHGRGKKCEAPPFAILYGVCQHCQRRCASHTRKTSGALWRPYQTFSSLHLV